MKANVEAIDARISQLLSTLKDTPISDAESYSGIVARITELQKVRNAMRPKIDPNTVLTVTANVVGLLTVLNFEKLGVITGKAFGMLIKPRS